MLKTFSDCTCLIEQVEQVVKVEDELSEEAVLDQGVPQGSIFGPTLFTI